MKNNLIEVTNCRNCLFEATRIDKGLICEHPNSKVSNKEMLISLRDKTVPVLCSLRNKNTTIKLKTA